MGILPAAVHRVLDYLVVLVFACAPFVLHLVGNTRMLAFVLAGVHLVLTLLTHFPGSSRGLVPFRVHGMIELVVGIVLVAVPLLRHWTFDARKLYLGMGVVILAVWALTRYHDEVAERDRIVTA